MFLHTGGARYIFWERQDSLQDKKQKQKQNQKNPTWAVVCLQRRVVIYREYKVSGPQSPSSGSTPV